MLAKINAGSSPGSPVYLTEKEFGDSLFKTTGDRAYCRNQEALQWSKGGRLGSHWQIDEVMYIKIKDAADDPFNYYSPPESIKSSTTSSWGGSCCGSSFGSCDKADCSC